MSPDEHQKAVEAFGEKGLKYEIFIKDVGAMQKALEQQIALRKVAHNSKAYDFENYHPYEEVLRNSVLISFGRRITQLIV